MLGTNIMGLGRSKCASYEWNERIRGILEELGFEVIGIPENQINISGGGLHCMTAPILREA